MGFDTKFRAIGGLVFGGLLLIGTAVGAPINGTLSLGGHTGQQVAVNLQFIDFDYSGGTANTVPPTATGTVDGNGDSAQFDILSGSTGSFAPLAGTQAIVADLDNGNGETAGTIILPTANGGTAGHFITFSANSWAVTLQEILPGNLPACTGSGDVACTPSFAANGVSPFDLVQQGNNVIASFAYNGTINDGQGNSSAATGTFSTTFSGTTVDQVLITVAPAGSFGGQGQGKSIVTGDTGTLFATAIPEPASGALIGGALLGLAALLRRFRKA
jgi:hypothetical protein